MLYDLIKHIPRAVAASIRQQGGRNAVETGFSESLTTRNKELQFLFESKTIRMKEKSKEKLQGDLIPDDRGYIDIETIGVTNKQYIH